ncbi:hypothetical protein HGRIS_008423 [Hohenbuehelia grisea]|uniref:BHLH domain-containing protein n=1 Tax=Hohenbuehelia grisea TaxID=104357 RepID=A0ABR3J7X3_9AGAR
MSNQQPPQPPPYSSDFEFSFDPAMSNVFPHPPPLPSSADLFSPSETTDLLGFLDNFNWDIDNPDGMAQHRLPKSRAPYSNHHLGTSPEPSTSTAALRHNTRSMSAGLAPLRADDQRQLGLVPRQASIQRSSASDSRAPSPGNSGTLSDGSRPKPLLSTPQKRLNHIMSEQKRRNAIRDGYAQLIALLAPAGSAPSLHMPTRGRPKGSGSRGKGKSKGKSGVLFRAVEYCQWLEEGRDALRDEVLRVEAAAASIQQQ